MKSCSHVLVACLLCFARALSEEAVEFGERSSAHEDLSRELVQKVYESNRQYAADKLRDKRALGLLLSGLAQIFGYTVTPIQLASLPNPNTTMPSATTGQQTAPSRPTSANSTAPRRQETLRFTGVVNFGNNSDIVGHLQRYERIFHGRNKTTVTTPRPTSTTKPSASLQTKPPLLAPFFVKIPLPIAPNLLPATLPIDDVNLSYPGPLFSVVSQSSASAKPDVRSGHETVYRNNEDNERYALEEKDIYDENDVRKPTSKYAHQLYVAEKGEATKGKKPARNDDDDDDDDGDGDGNDESSAESYEERADRKNLAKSSKQPTERNKNERVEDYSNYDDDDDDDDDDDGPKSRFNGYKRPPPINFGKYVEVGYQSQQLPIGDYFHDGDADDIRDSYGEVLDDKKLEDDRLSGYFGMFKHPYTDTYDFQAIHDPEDASRESVGANDYDERPGGVEKLREDYALPENKYEEYDINGESEENRDDRGSERARNRAKTLAGQKGPKRERARDKDTDSKTTTEASTSQPRRNDGAKLEDARSREETDFARYTPLIVPVRYIDATDKPETARRRKLKGSGKPKNSGQSVNEAASTDVASTAPRAQQLQPQLGPPDRPRQLHEGERKDYQAWPPPFDYAFDYSERTNTVVPPASPRNYLLDYYPHVVTNVAANGANNANPSEQSPGYLVVVSDPVHSYQYPYNVHYFPKQVVDPRHQDPRLSAAGAHPRDESYSLRQDANQQRPVQTNSNLVGRNDTARDPNNNYYQFQQAPADAFNRYVHVFGERVPQAVLPNADARGQISNAENWSSKVYHRPQPRSDAFDRAPPGLVQLQSVASASWNARGVPKREATVRAIAAKKKAREPGAAGERARG